MQSLILEDFEPSPPRLRVAVVTETFPPEINGVAMTVGRLVDGLRRRGHAIQLVRPRQGSEDGSAAEERFEVVLERGVPIPRYAGLRMGLPAKRALLRHWARRRPDVVHVVTEGPLGWSAVAAARQLKLPVTSAFHTNFHTYSRHYGIGWLTRPIAGYLKAFHNRTDATFVPTAALMRELGRAGFRRLELVARGVDTTLFSPQRRTAALRSAWGVGEHGLAVLHVGRIAPEKNLPLLLRAFALIRAAHPQARLILVGDGPSRADLQSSGAGHHFAGMRTGTDLAAHYASADLFLFPSLTETFGNVVPEAMASGLPVVAFDCAAAAELIRDRSNGWLAPPGDEAAFVAAALAAADAPPELRREIGHHARRAVEPLDWERVHDGLAALLARVVGAAERKLHAETALVVAPD
jgi:glycosyltransferase involved in cell wall biosynthesis